MWGGYKGGLFYVVGYQSVMGLDMVYKLNTGVLRTISDIDFNAFFALRRPGV